MLGSEYSRWLNDGGQKMMYQFDGILSSDSIVFDIGGYKGLWSYDMSCKYKCRIFVFEPVLEFFQLAVKQLSQFKNVEVMNYGVGGKDRQEQIVVCADGSSIYLDKKNKTQEITIKSIDTVLKELDVDVVNLASINIEGGEYELLNFMLEENLVERFNRLLIQFHEIGSFTYSDRKNIRERLSQTHIPVYLYDSVWELWQNRILLKKEKPSLANWTEND